MGGAYLTISQSFPYSYRVTKSYALHRRVIYVGPEKTIAKGQMEDELMFP